MLELDLALTARQALAECRRRGLVVRSESGGHWHLGFPDRPGTLELNDSDGRVWVKVHSLRDGGWATGVAHELAEVPSD